MRKAIYVLGLLALSFGVVGCGAGMSGLASAALTGLGTTGITGTTGTTGGTVSASGLVGTWKESAFGQHLSSITMNSNGTFTESGMGITLSGSWAVQGNNLILNYNGGLGSETDQILSQTSNQVVFYSPDLGMQFTWTR